MPARSLGDAKTRLENVVPARWRRELVRAMFVDVLAATAAARVVAGAVVVTRDPEVARIARDHGAGTVREPAALSFPDREPDRNHELNAALRTAAGALAGRGADGVIVVPADLPLLTGADLDRLASALAHGPAVALVADRAGTGTNALACRPPLAIPFTFGPHSAAAHRAHAQRLGLPFAALSLDSVALDLDTEDDLEALRRCDPSGATRRVLDSLSRIPPATGRSPARDLATDTWRGTPS